MAYGLNGSASGDTAPVIHYDVRRYRLFVLLGLVLAGAVLADGIARRDPAQIAAAAAGLVIVGLIAYGTHTKLTPSAVALAREGDLLVGGELPQPLPIAATTFEIVPDHQGSWMIVLRSPRGTTRLGAGGWRLEGERLFTRAVAESTLLAFGLTRREPRRRA